MKQESLKFSGRASNPATKKFSPAQIAAQKLFAERARAGTLGKTVKRNPDKAKPRAYVKRASQATGAPPSKRLVTRRKKALTAPAGYFPNPKTKKAATLQDRVKKFKVELNFDKFKTFKKVVGYYPSDTSPDYELVALFQTQAQAVNAAESYAENYPKYRWFVKGL
jgi:hypothetical protein